MRSRLFTYRLSFKPTVSTLNFYHPIPDDQIAHKNTYLFQLATQLRAPELSNGDQATRITIRAALCQRRE